MVSSLPRYRGPIHTVEHAFWAGMVLNIRCQRCCRARSRWAYLLCLRRPSAKALPLHKEVDGFFCRGCERSTKVTISARRDGEL
jgi:hypothetical protein